MRNALKDSPFRHYVLAREADIEALQAEYRDDDRLFVLSYGSNFSDLGPFLEEVDSSAKSRAREHLDGGITKNEASASTSSVPDDIFKKPLPILATPKPKGPLYRMPDVTTFFGYEEEYGSASQAVETGCSMLVLHGMGGVGKTFLTAKIVKEYSANFDKLLWISLRNAPSLRQVISECFSSLEPLTPFDEEWPIQECIAGIIDIFSRNHHLVVFDNLETIYQSGYPTGTYRHGYGDYAEFLGAIADYSHMSTVIITTRELPTEIRLRVGSSPSMHAIALNGLDKSASVTLLEHSGMRALQPVLEELGRLLHGNPEALRLTQALIDSTFSGNVEAFLSSRLHILGDITTLFEEHVARISKAERAILYSLTLSREPLTLQSLANLMTYGADPQEVAAACESLVRRSLVDVLPGGGTPHLDLQNLLSEFLAERIISEARQELLSGSYELLRIHALMRASVPDYVRLSQERVFVQPVMQGLRRQLGTEEAVAAHLLGSIRDLHTAPRTGYVVGNIINLLIQLPADLNGIDLSGLEIREVYFPSANIANANLCNALVENCTFLGDFDNILSVAFSPNGLLLATASMSGDVRVWSINGWNLLWSARRHTDWVWSVAFSPDGSALASGSADQSVSVWRADSGDQLRVLRGHKERVFSVAWSPAGFVAAGGEDATIRWWDSSGKPLGSIVGPSKIWSLEFDSKGNIAAAGCENGTVVYWHVLRDEVKFAVDAHGGRIRGLAFHPGGDVVATGGQDGFVRLWTISPDGHALIAEIQHGTGQVHDVAFSPDGGMLATAGEDSAVHLWVYPSLEHTGTIRGHQNAVLSLAFSPGGRQLATGSDDQTARVWDIASRNCVSRLIGFTNPLWSVADVRAFSWLATGGEDGVVRLWDGERCVRQLTGHRARVWAVAAASAGPLLASSSEDGTIRMWNVNDGSYREVPNITTMVRSIAINTAGNFLVSGRENAIRVWDTHTTQVVADFGEHTDWVRSVAFLPGDRFVVSGGEDGVVEIWDVVQGWRAARWRAHEAGIWAVAVRYDGLVASGSRDHTVKLWRLGQGNVGVLTGHSGWIRSVAFAPAGDRLATTSEDLSVGLWNLADPASPTVRFLHGHEARPISVTFASDGGSLASVGQDQTMRLWDSKTGEVKHVLRAERPYEGVRVRNLRGLTEAERKALRALGALDNEPPSRK